jgi:hypothetical protein
VHPAPEETEELVKCHLCNKERPVFAGDEGIKRLPDISLSLFLQQLKSDANDKARYLNKLRITTDRIRPCSCPITVHAYCQTAQIIQKKQIFCTTCNEAYSLHLEKHSSDSLNFGVKNLAFTFFAWVIIALLVFFDGYLKCSNDGDKPTVSEIIKDCVNFRLFFHLAGMIVPFTMWSFLIKFFYTRSSSKERIGYVECLNYSSPPAVGRAQSKLNLHAIIMDSGRKVKQPELFDFFWYERRTEIKIRNRLRKEEEFAQRMLAKQAEIEEMKNIKNSSHNLIKEEKSTPQLKPLDKRDSQMTFNLPDKSQSISPLKNGNHSDTNSKSSLLQAFNNMSPQNRSSQQPRASSELSINQKLVNDQFSIVSLGSTNYKKLNISSSHAMLEERKEKQSIGADFKDPE